MPVVQSHRFLNELTFDFHGTKKLAFCYDVWTFKNETLYHIAHPLRCPVLLSIFFFSFSFAEVRQFLVVKKKKKKPRARSLLFDKGELFPSTVALL